MHHGRVRTLASCIGDDRGKTAVWQLAARAMNLWGLLRTRTMRTDDDILYSVRSFLFSGILRLPAHARGGNEPIETLEDAPAGKLKRRAALARGPSSVSVAFFFSRALAITRRAPFQRMVIR
ncbi:hypothetical protein ACFW04_006003 [Cataglyphis niger]